MTGPLSHRELLALAQVAVGLSGAETACRLSTSLTDVAVLLTSARRKLQTSSTAAAVLAARQQGLLPGSAASAGGSPRGAGPPADVGTNE